MISRSTSIWMVSRLFKKKKVIHMDEIQGKSRLNPCGYPYGYPCGFIHMEIQVIIFSRVVVGRELYIPRDILLTYSYMLAYTYRINFHIVQTFVEK